MPKFFNIYPTIHVDIEVSMKNRPTRHFSDKFINLKNAQKFVRQITQEENLMKHWVNYQIHVTGTYGSDRYDIKFNVLETFHHFVEANTPHYCQCQTRPACNLL